MDDFSVRQGWQCPLCKRVYSPFTPVCSYCGGEAIIKTSTDMGRLHIGEYTITYPLRGEESEEKE